MKRDKTELNDELRPPYDETLLKKGIRGKYAKQYAAGTTLFSLTQMLPPLFLLKKPLMKLCDLC